MARGRHFDLSSVEGYLKSPLYQYLIMAVEGPNRKELQAPSGQLEASTGAAPRSRNSLGWKAFKGSIVDQGCFQGDPDPAEVVEVSD